MSYLVYHNPRCSKSRQGLAYLTEKGIDPVVKEYLKENITEEELGKVIQQLGMKPEELIRKNEAEYKEHFKNKKLSDAEWIKAMVKFPKLIERPIIIHNNKAVIARPIENIDDLF